MLDLTRLLETWPEAIRDAWQFGADSLQRSVLFWDVLRRRGNVYLEHKKAGKPPVLTFDYELLMDGRELEKPANYALLEIKPLEGMTIDPAKRPYVIVDPRAGHGPGIGGFKTDSQVGAAMRAGHPVYFISFFPEPVAGQTLRDVADVEACFLEEIIRRHPETDAKPAVIGNCQAGWAVAGLSALRPDLVGPIILNGAPLSYWAGREGANPMRYLGGLLGGKWAQSLACDLGNGRFDGALLVGNFERLSPANTLWTKQYNLYSKIDTEEKRFLGFEKWWGGFFLMNREEIDAIVSELFIGNKLADRERSSRDGAVLDLRNIRSPIIVFASWGDNITPPQQALNWIVDLYGHEDEIVRRGQVIVYMLHEGIGHLGIFVSGKVAKKEHAEIIGTMQLVNALPPGLYEMVIDEKPSRIESGELVEGDYLVRVERRRVADIRALDDELRDEEYFTSVAAVSEINDRLYRRFVSPWVRLFTNELTAELLRTMNPVRAQRELISDRNPFLRMLEPWARWARGHRRVADEHNPFRVLERDVSRSVEVWLNSFRDVRDSFQGTWFKMIYGPLGLGMLFPPERPAEIDQPKPVEAHDDFVTLWQRAEEGGFAEAVSRMILAILADESVLERRFHKLAREVMDSEPRIATIGYEARRAIIMEQSMILGLDRNRALQALTVLLPRKSDRRDAVGLVREALKALIGNDGREKSVVRKISAILDVDWASTRRRLSSSRPKPVTPAVSMS